MIRLLIAPEPASFAKKVREPGENILALLAGKLPPHKRSGRPPMMTKLVGGKNVPKTVDDFPYWQDCLEDLHAVYDGICAYYAFRIEKASMPHVDHFIAKHRHESSHAYEWNNFRLACGYANTCKNDYPDVLDPASIEDGWFRIDLVTLRVYASPGLDKPLAAAVESTITRLKLGEGRALEVRQRAMAHFRSGRVQIEFLDRDHPFLAKELTRQGIRTIADIPSVPPQVLAGIEPELQLGSTAASEPAGSNAGADVKRSLSVHSFADGAKSLVRRS